MTLIICCTILVIPMIFLAIDAAVNDECFLDKLFVLKKKIRKINDLNQTGEWKRNSACR